MVPKAKRGKRSTTDKNKPSNNRQRQVALWLPVSFGLGIHIYFSLSTEPQPVLAFTLSALLGAILVALNNYRPVRDLAMPIVTLALAASLGFACAQLRAHYVSAAKLSSELTANIEGRIRGIDSTSSGAIRLLLDQITITGFTQEETPQFVRLALFDAAVESEPRQGKLAIGERVSTTAKLFPPRGSAEPGARNFSFFAWFQRIGATGYTGKPLTQLPSLNDPTLMEQISIKLGNWRWSTARYLHALMPDGRGAIVAALSVGIRYGTPEEALEHMREANLAHLLAISGLHMAIVTGISFLIARMLLNIIPGISDRAPTKKIAAIFALIVALTYLTMSGASLPTQRAFIMVAVMLGAILANRRAITLRALAIAALLILIIRPESLYQIGFQLSFAATAALIAFYRDTRPLWQRWVAPIGFTGKVISYLLALIASAFIAGSATAPFAAYHFNQLIYYGTLANFLSMPIMGFWIAPSAIAALFASAFSLADYPLLLMGSGVEAILKIAEFVSSLEGATRPIKAGPPLALTLICMGGLFICLWHSRLWFRVCLASALIFSGIFLWTQEKRPFLLVGEDARLTGYLGPEGRALDRKRGQGFTAKIWLQRDGDLANQEQAAARPGIKRAGVSSIVLENGWQVHILYSRYDSVALLTRLCRPNSLIISQYLRFSPKYGRKLRHGEKSIKPQKRCIFIGKEDLARFGSMAIDPDGRNLHLKTSNMGIRPWNHMAAN